MLSKSNQRNTCPRHLPMKTCDLPRSLSALDLDTLDADECSPVELESIFAEMLSQVRSISKDRPLAPKGEIAADRQTRLKIYRKRRKAGLAIFHPLDSWQLARKDLKVGALSEREEEDGTRRAARLANGRPNDEETLTTESESA